MGGLSEALAKLRSGEESFAVFVRKTKTDWERMAGKLFGRWRLPCGVTVDDVEQEMLLAAWQAAVAPPPRGWDSTRGIPLVTHVVWSAHSVAKKWIHTQRKAKRRDDSAPSRHPTAISAMGLDAEGELGLAAMLDLVVSQEPEQEGKVDERAALKLLPGYASDDCGKAALERWLEASCDVEEAARLWYEDPKERLRWRMECDEHAVKLVRRALANVGKKLDVVMFEEKELEG